MIQENLRVTAQTVISQMLEGHKTFADLAERYGMEEEDFKQVVARVVNDKDYPRLEKANDKYIASRNRIRKNKIPIQKPQVKERETNPVLSKRKKLVKYLVFIDKKREYCQVYTEGKKADLTEATLELEEAKKELEEAEKKVKAAQKTYELKNGQVQEAGQQLESLDKERESINKQIQEIDSNIIFLVAPDYQGKKPEYGTLISVVPMEGAIVEDVSDVVLISEMTAEEMFLFDSMESAKAANQYIKLVTKYFVDDKEYQLMVDNDILIKLLEKQELIEEEVERTS